MKSICAELVLRNASQSAGTPWNRRLYEILKAAIAGGELTPGAALPASRDLAEELGVSRNTVTHAYDQLRAEGYVRSRVGSGTYVSERTPESYLSTGRAKRAPRKAAVVARLSRRADDLLREGSASAAQWGAFMPGVPDVTEFPKAEFGRLLSRLWHRAAPQDLTYSHGGGHPELRSALADHLRIARGVQCDAERMLVTEGVHQAIDLCVRLLADPGDTIWIEEPGYWGFRKHLQLDSFDVRPLNVESMDPSALPDGPVPRIIFVTPSHQYPLGNVMPMNRRVQLLDFARANGCWIVEDDYDSEFRFEGKPIPAMQGLDSDAPVVYVGTFSKTLFPALRVGYMVLPPEIVAPFKQAHADLYREGHSITHLALAQWIQDGRYAAHIRRMRLIYARRRAQLATLITTSLGPEYLRTEASNAGLHLVLALPANCDDAALVRAALSKGVLTTALSSYYQHGARRRGLLLGYACVPDQEILPSFAKLLGCIQDSLHVAAARRSRGRDRQDA